MTILEQNSLERDDRDILQDRFHSFKTLKRKHDQLDQHFGHALWITLQAETVFVLMLTARIVPQLLVSVLCGTFAACLILWRAAPVMIITIGVLFCKLHKRAWRRPMIYWSWWPFWSFGFCCLAACSAAYLGRFLWESTLYHYYEMDTLQTYQEVNVDVMPGSELMDAGLVTFAEGTGIDRSHGGCFVNLGHTYCVAPIAHAGRLSHGVGGGPTFGSYDYFAVGIDCCNCPMQDFRCGEWFNPLAHGGMRSLDYRSRPFYKLAVDDFTAAWQKESRHPLFFDWVGMPDFRWKSAYHWSMHCYVLAVFTPIPIVFLLATLAGQWLQHLVTSTVASPLNAPQPPESLERVWKYFLPELSHQFAEEQAHLLALPISPTPWYASTASRRIDDDPRPEKSLQSVMGRTTPWYTSTISPAGVIQFQDA